MVDKGFRLFYCLYFGCKLAFRALAPSGPANMTQISERFLVQAHLDAKQPKALSPAEQARYRADIAAELKKQDAVLVAHYYCDPVIQALADETDRKSVV